MDWCGEVSSIRDSTFWDLWASGDEGILETKDREKLMAGLISEGDEGEGEEDDGMVSSVTLVTACLGFSGVRVGVAEPKSRRVPTLVALEEGLVVKMDAESNWDI